MKNMYITISIFNSIKFICFNLVCDQFFLVYNSYFLSQCIVQVYFFYKHIVIGN